MKTLGSVVFEALLYCFEMLSDLYNKVLWRTRDAGSRQELDLCGSGGGSDGGCAPPLSQLHGVSQQNISGQ